MTSAQHNDRRPPSFRLRQATAADCWRVHALANEDAARAMSFTRRTIDPGEHRHWFDSKLDDPDTSLYLALNDEDEAIGFARFEKHGDEITISVALDKSWRGRGLGALLISRALHKYRQYNRDDVVRAYIRRDNRVSQKAFQNAGFRYHSVSIINGLEAVCFESNADGVNDNA